MFDHSEKLPDGLIIGRQRRTMCLNIHVIYESNHAEHSVYEGCWPVLSRYDRFIMKRYRPRLRVSVSWWLRSLHLCKDRNLPTSSRAPVLSGSHLLLSVIITRLPVGIERKGSHRDFGVHYRGLMLRRYTFLLFFLWLRSQKNIRRLSISMIRPTATRTV
jgi:hypothetical protein